MKLASEFVSLSSATRLHHFKVPVVGLTGGIGTGKSTVSKLLMKAGLPLIDADALVKEVYALPETIQFITSINPLVVSNGVINFKLMREHFFTKQELKSKVETHIYQKLPELFTKTYQNLGSPEFVIYDVPLLFERKLQDSIDLCVVVYAPESEQLKRVMARDGVSLEGAKAVLSHQMNIEEKRKLAHHVIDNSGDEAQLQREVGTFLKTYFI